MNEKQNGSRPKRRKEVGVFGWTLATVLSLGSVILGKRDLLQIVITVVFAINAGILWKKYIIERQEEKDHD